LLKTFHSVWDGAGFSISLMNAWCIQWTHSLAFIWSNGTKLAEVVYRITTWSTIPTLSKNSLTIRIWYTMRHKLWGMKSQIQSTIAITLCTASTLLWKPDWAYFQTSKTSGRPSCSTSSRIQSLSNEWLRRLTFTRTIKV
jgi:hypothetical protein